MSKGPLMTRIQAANKAEVAHSVVNRYIQKGLVEPIVIDGYEFVYYRDVLRASWKAAQRDNRYKGKNK